MVMAYPPNVRLCARHKIDAKMAEVKKPQLWVLRCHLFRGPISDTHTCPIEEQVPYLGSAASCVYLGHIAHHTEKLFAKLSVSHASSLGS